MPSFSCRGLGCLVRVGGGLEAGLSTDGVVSEGDPGESQASGSVGADQLRWGRASRMGDVDQVTVRVAPRAAAHSRGCA
jgi:hypothetical protein